MCAGIKVAHASGREEMVDPDFIFIKPFATSIWTTDGVAQLAASEVVVKGQVISYKWEMWIKKNYWTFFIASYLGIHSWDSWRCLVASLHSNGFHVRRARGDCSDRSSLYHGWQKKP
jgi:hypothetical protein